MSNKIFLTLFLALVNFSCGEKEKDSVIQNSKSSLNDSSTNQVSEPNIPPATSVVESSTPTTVVPSETEKHSDLPPEESLVVKIDPDTIDSGSSEIRDGLQYVKGSSTPYSGKVYKTFENGNREMELDLKNGIPDGMIVTYYENGQKKEQSNFKEGKPADGEWFAWHENGELKVEIIIENGETVSEKFWNSEGVSVESKAESEK